MCPASSALKARGLLFLLCLSVVFSLFSSQTFAFDVTLAWDPNTEPDLAGYKVYYKSVTPGPPYLGIEADQGPSPITLTLKQDDSQHPLVHPDFPGIKLSGLIPNYVYFFAVTAYDSQGLESAFSAEVSTDFTPPGKPGSLNSASPVGTWLKEGTVKVFWDRAEDSEPASGLEGYSVVWDQNPKTVPDTLKDIGPEITMQSPILVEGSSWFHLRAVDKAGNWGETAHLGPFLVDTRAPLIEEPPVLDRESFTVQIVFSEGNMENGATAENYSFDNGLLLSGNGKDLYGTRKVFVFQIDPATFRQYAIYTMTVSENVRDAAGNRIPAARRAVTINDDDGDGMADSWERDYSANNPKDDHDRDGLTNAEEYRWGGNPRKADTDGDGIPDRFEAAHGLSLKTSDAEADRDGDGWTNFQEYRLGTNPSDSSSHPAPGGPEILEVIPHDQAGIDDLVPLPPDTSFCARVRAVQGMDLTRPGDATLIINDGQDSYARNLGDKDVVRAVNLTGEPDRAAGEIWLVYDRAKEEALGLYPPGSTVTVEVRLRDRKGFEGEEVVSSFRVEPGEKDRNAAGLEQEFLSEPEGPYDSAIRVTKGQSRGATIYYSSGEPARPRFGPPGDIPPLDEALGQSAGEALNLQPPTVFNTPVKLLIPCAGRRPVNELSLFLFNGSGWVRACDKDGNVLPGGEAWMVPGSRVNHHAGDTPAVEIMVHHFTGAVAGMEAEAGRDPLLRTDDASSCFISTIADRQ